MAGPWAVTLTFISPLPRDGWTNPIISPRHGSTTSPSSLTLPYIVSLTLLSAVLAFSLLGLSSEPFRQVQFLVQGPFPPIPPPPPFFYSSLHSGADASQAPL